VLLSWPEFFQFLVDVPGGAKKGIHILWRSLAKR